MSAAQEVAAAWREDMDRLHVGIARLEDLLERRTQERDEAIEHLRRLELGNRDERARVFLESYPSVEHPPWRRFDT